MPVAFDRIAPSLSPQVLSGALRDHAENYFGAASTIAWPVTASAQSMPRHRAETSTQHVTPAGSTNQPIGLVWARQLLVGSGSFLTDKRFELRLLGRNYLDV